MDNDFSFPDTSAKSKLPPTFIASPSFLADSSCLSAFGSKINISSTVLPIKSILKKFEEEKQGDYVKKLDEL